MKAIHLVVASALAASCTPAPRPDRAAPPPPPPPALTPQDLLGASYRLGFVENDLGTVSFTDSLFVDTTRRTRVKLFRTATGDLDGDGVGDGVALIGMNFGGTGTFILAVPVLNRDGRPVQGKGAGLGDRTHIQAVRIDSGVVSLDMIAHRPDDPMCCPTDTVTQRYRLVGDSLALQP